MRQIVLDTETTGLEPSMGHRIIEIGCVEVVDRRLTGNHYHQYIQPEREIDEGALEVHGITPEFLADKPVFAKIVDEFIQFVDGAELVIHNAPFDIGFLDAELERLANYQPIGNYCTVLDTLVMARSKHPGQKNNLDALCRRYEVDDSRRDLHGALLDAELLAQVYLSMTGGQTALQLSGSGDSHQAGISGDGGIRRLPANRPPLVVLAATAEELVLHEEKLTAIEQASGQCLWRGQSDQA